MTRDVACRLGISARYARPPDDGAPLGDWREYADRLLSEASVRGLVVTVVLSDPEDDAACVAEMRAEHDADARRMNGDE